MCPGSVELGCWSSCDGLGVVEHLVLDRGEPSWVSRAWSPVMCCRWWSSIRKLMADVASEVACGAARRRGGGRRGSAYRAMLRLPDLLDHLLRRVGGP